MSSGISEKARAVFLAAIMMLSVVAMTTAFAGSAAAQTAGDEITVDNLSDLETNVTGSGDADPGDTIIVEEGSYNSDGISVGVENITIRAADGQNPQINLTNNNQFVINSNDVTVRGLSIDRPNDGNSILSAIGDSPTIEDNELDGGPLAVSGSGDITLRDNTLVGTNPADGHGIFITSTAGDVVIKQNNLTEWEAPANEFADVLVTSEINSLNGETDMEAGALTVLADNADINSTNLQAAKVTAIKPDDTVQDAVDRASQDYEVLVLPGTYEESIVIDGTNNLTLQGVEDANGNSPVIVGDGANVGSQPHAAIQVDGNGPTQETTIEGFTIRNPDGHYGVYAGTGGSNSDVDGFVLRNNTIEDIATNISSHNPLAGVVSGLYVRAQYDSITVEDNTIRNVNTKGDNSQNAVGLSFSSFIGDEAFADTDPGSETAENTSVQNNVVTNITGAEGSRTKGISVSGEFDGLTIANNTVTAVSANTTDSNILAITLTENPGKSGSDIDGDGTNERIGPRNFEIRDNDIDELSGADEALVFVGGYEDLGDNHVVEDNNFLDTDAGVSRFAQDQTGFNPGDEDTLDATSNWWGATNGPSGDFDGNGSAVTGPVSIDPATVSLDDGSVNLTQDFLGVVKDSQNVTLSDTSDATFSFDSESVPGDVDGTLVLGINGTDYVFEDVLDDGAINTSASGAEVDSGKNGTSIANTTPTGDTAITVVGNNSTTAVSDTGTIRLVHEVQNIGEGYTLTSLPQPAEVYTTDVSDFTSWSNADSNYDDSALSTDGSLVRNSEAIHKGQYANGDSSDARIGYDFVTPSESDVQLGAGGVEELGEGFHLVGSNYNIEGSNTEIVDRDLSTVRDLPDGDDYKGNESFVVYDPVSFGEVGGDSTVDNYEGYWVYVDVGEDTETRTIKLARYDPAAS